MKRVPVVLVMASAFVAAGLAGCQGADEARLVGTLERDRIEIVSEAAEPILSLEVREGQHVEAGQVLLRQDTAVAAARAAQAEARVSEARERLTELKKGPRSETIQEARARLQSAEAALQRDERELARAVDLVEQRLVSESRLDEARAARDRSRAALNEARAQLDELLHGTRTEQIEQARAALAAAESALRQVELTDARLVVRATRSGVVEALPYETGERPPPGTPVAILLADTPAYARVYVPEPDRARVHAGSRARIHVDGIEQPLPGVVRYVASDASFTPYYALTQRDRSRLTFLSEVEVTDARGQQLPAGVPVEVEILGDEPG